MGTVRDAMQILDIVSPGDLDIHLDIHRDIHRDVSRVGGGSVERVPARCDFRLTLNGRLVQQEIAARDEIN